MVEYANLPTDWKKPVCSKRAIWGETKGIRNRILKQKVRKGKRGKEGGKYRSLPPKKHREQTNDRSLSNGILTEEKKQKERKNPEERIF